MLNNADWALRYCHNRLVASTGLSAPPGCAVLRSVNLLNEPVGMSPLTGSFFLDEMDLVLVRAKYDVDTGRTYVEFRGSSDGDSDAIVTVIFSYKNVEWLSKARVQEDIERKGRHLLKSAAIAK